MPGVTILDREAMRRLADALGESVRGCVSVSLLRRGLCRASVVGSPDDFVAALVAFDFMSDEPTAFGRDADAIVDLLEETDREWGCVETTPDMAASVGESIERRLGCGVRYYDSIYLEMVEPAIEIVHPQVRMLVPGDEDLWANVGDPEMRAGGFGDERTHLRESFAAAAIEGDRIVSIAQTSAITERYADIGIHTLETHRRQGLASACASMAAKEAQRRELTPVWSTGVENKASLATARRIGFQDADRGAYAILMK